MIVPLKDTWPICQGVRHAVAKARIEGFDPGRVSLPPDGWNAMLLELSGSRAELWSVLREDNRIAIELVAAGLKLPVHCDPKLTSETVELLP